MRTQRIALVLAALALVAGGAMLIGATFWPFVVLSVATATVGLAPRIGVVDALAATLVWVLVGILLVTTVGAAIPIPLGVLVAALLLGAIGAGVGGALTGPAWTPARPDWLELGVGVVPAIACWAAMAVGGTLFGTRIAWAMNGDAQYNTVLAGLIVEHNGVTPEYFEVPSLAQSMLAVAHIPGRWLVPAESLLVHDVQAQAQVWTTVIALSSVLLALAAGRELRGVRRHWRIIGVLGAGLLPLLWFLTAFSLESGFYNTSIALLVFALAWLVWQRAVLQQGWAIAALGGTVTLMLGAWTPLAVIPGALLVAAVVLGFRSTERRSLLRNWMVWASAVQLVGYVVAVALPALIGHGDGLAQAGRIFRMPEMLYPLLASLLLIVALVLWRGPAGTAAFRLGVPLLIAAGTLGLVYLVVVNLRVGEAWSYYSIKFAWLLVTFALFLLIIGVVRLLDQHLTGRVPTVLATAAVVMLLWSSMSTAPLASHGGLGSMPLISTARNGAVDDPAVPLLSELAGSRTMFLDYSEEHDTFLNRWLFQLGSDGHKNDVWTFAYTVFDSPADVCAAAEVWGGEATVYTASDLVAERLDDRCGDLVDVVVAEPDFG